MKNDYISVATISWPSMAHNHDTVGWLESHRANINKVIACIPNILCDKKTNRASCTSQFVVIMKYSTHCKINVCRVFCFSCFKIIVNKLDVSRSQLLGLLDSVPRILPRILYNQRWISKIGEIFKTRHDSMYIGV